MPFGSKAKAGWRGLGGATKKEDTREELLAKVKAEREARGQARKQEHAAVTIQRYWWGHIARSAVHAKRVQVWLQLYGPAATDPSVLLPAQQLLTEAVPMLIRALGPWFQQHKISLSERSPQSAGSSASHLSKIQTAQDVLLVARGGLSLLLRSAASTDPAFCCCAPAAHADSAPQWSRQCCTMLRLCAELHLAAGSHNTNPQPIIMLSAARLLVLLTNPSQLRLSLTAEELKTAQEAVRQAVLLLASAPSAVLQAAAAAVSINAEQGHGETDMNGDSNEDACATSLRLPAGVKLQDHELTRSRLLGVAVLMLETACGPSCTRELGERVCEEWVKHLFVLPQLLPCLTTSMKASLTHPPLLSLLMATISSLICRTPNCFGSAAAAAQVLATLVQLVAGEATTRKLPTGASVPYLQRSEVLNDPSLAASYMCTVSMLLQASLSRAGAAAKNSHDFRQATASWWPLADRTHVLQLLDASADAEAKQNGAKSAKAAAGPDSRVPSAGINADQSESGMALFCRLCSILLLHVAPLCQLPGGGQAAGMLPNPLNTLAFAPPLLPRLWSWLTTNLGVPREAPVEATRGLDVGSLAGGITGLIPAHAQVLGVFCRVYAHLLLALDDNDFYSGTDPFTLAQTRAITASLNSLVFHTYFPVDPGPGSRPPPNKKDDQLVAEWAPAVLRDLYERDVRRSFCQPRLWLAPYLEMTGQTMEDVTGERVGKRNQGTVIKHFNTAAVAQVLIAGRTDDSDDTPSALQTTAGEGNRPASLASLLRAAPQCVPFSHRVDLFRDLLARDKAASGFDRAVHEGGVPPMRVKIRRECVMQDAYQSLGHLGAGLKKKLHVTYINAQGLQEAGLDQGGLTKEFLDDVVRMGLGADLNLFAASESGLAYPTPSANRLADGLRLLNFVGLMVGKALYEGILLDVRFAPFFIARLQGRRPTFDDLESLDPGLYRSLQQVKHYQGDVEDLGLTFSVDDESLRGRSEDLIPGWGSRPVTNDNKLLYCHLMADWHLNVKLGSPAAAFAAGLAHIIPPTMLRLFNPQEVNELISGGSFSGLDIADMKRWTLYSGGYSSSSISIMLFWRIVADFTPQQQSQLLKFITSCSRPPLGGFEYLQPPLTIHMVDCDASLFARIGGKDVDRLPSASTCYNMLKLPNYRRPGTMKAKLLCAISSGAGFELS